MSRPTPATYKTTNWPAYDSSQDIRVSASGIIDAVGTTGGTSVAVNTWNASGWIGR